VGSNWWQVSLQWLCKSDPSIKPVDNHFHVGYTERGYLLLTLLYAIDRCLSEPHILIMHPFMLVGNVVVRLLNGLLVVIIRQELLPVGEAQRA